MYYCEQNSHYSSKKVTKVILSEEDYLHELKLQHTVLEQFTKDKIVENKAKYPDVQLECNINLYIFISK